MLKHTNNSAPGSMSIHYIPGRGPAGRGTIRLLSLTLLFAVVGFGKCESVGRIVEDSQLRAAARLIAQGKLSQAEHVAREAVRLLKSSGDDCQFAMALNNLGVLYTRLMRLEEAENVLRRALSVHGGTDAKSAVYWNNLAEVHRQSGQWAKAEAVHGRLLRMYASGPSKDSREHATVLSNLALVYHAQGKAGRAEPMFAEALRMFTREPLTDPETLTQLLNNLGSARTALGRYGEARQAYERALALAEQHLPAHHPSRAATLHNLAGLFLEEEKFDLAAALYRQAIGLWTSDLGPDHVYIGSALGNLATIAVRLERYAEAEEHYGRALPILVRTYGRDHPETLKRTGDYAQLLRKTGRKSEARAMERAFSKLLDSHHEENVGIATVDVNDLQRKR